MLEKMMQKTRKMIKSGTEKEQKREEKTEKKRCEKELEKERSTLQKGPGAERAESSGGTYKSTR